MVVTAKRRSRLSGVTGDEAETDVDDVPTVGEALGWFLGRLGRASDRIADDGRPGHFVNVEAEDSRLLNGLHTPVEGGDEVTALAAVAGG